MKVLSQKKVIISTKKHKEDQMVLTLVILDLAASLSSMISTPNIKTHSAKRNMKMKNLKDCSAKFAKKFMRNNNLSGTCLSANKSPHCTENDNNFKEQSMILMNREQAYPKGSGKQKELKKENRLNL